MKQPIIKSTLPVAYKFTRLTPTGYSVKDSCSFAWLGVDYMICTDIAVGGLSVFKFVNGEWLFHQRLFSGWSRMWAPCVIEVDNVLWVFCNDTGGAEPFWQTQRIKRFSYDPVKKTCGGVIPVDVGADQGVIDPEIFTVGNTVYMAVTVMDWKNGEWWDIWCSKASHPFGPYTGIRNFSGVEEHGQEEAFQFNKYDGFCYWSIGDSSVNAEIRRGSLLADASGNLNISEDFYFKMKAEGSPICTHPDSWNGRLRATLKDSNGFYIGEIEV